MLLLENSDLKISHYFPGNVSWLVSHAYPKQRTLLAQCRMSCWPLVQQLSKKLRLVQHQSSLPVVIHCIVLPHYKWGALFHIISDLLHTITQQLSILRHTCIHKA